MTDEGQELTEDLKKDLKDLSKRLKKNLHNLEDVTKEKFDELVASVVEQYSKMKELAADAKDKLVNALKAKWHEMEAEYLDGKNE